MMVLTVKHGAELGTKGDRAMSNVLQIPSNNPDHKTAWKVNIWFDAGMLCGARGHSEHAYNFNILDDDMLWDVDNAAIKYLLDRVENFLEKEGYIVKDECGFCAPTKKLINYFKV